MNIGWPEGIWIVMVMLSGLLEAERHGKPKEGTNNFSIWFMSAIISVGLLSWGGFFK